MTVTPELIQTGFVALQQGDSAFASTMFSDILKDDPVNVEALIGITLAHYSSGSRVNAEKSIRQALQIEPKHKTAIDIALQMGLSPQSLPGAFNWQVVTARQYAEQYPSSTKTEYVSEISHYTDLKPVSITTIRDVGIAGRDNALVTPDGRILRESTADDNTTDALKSLWLVHPQDIVFEKKTGAFVSLTGVWAEGFYHWLTEWLPKVILAQKIGFTGTYVVPRGVTFCIESLKLLGVEADKILEAPQNAWIAEELIVPEAIPGQCLREYPALAQELRTRLIDGARAASSLEKVSEYSERIYIARRNPDRPRKVVNEKELELLLIKYGVSIVDAANLSLADQITIASRANLLVGASGAGIMHSFFMKGASTVIELFSPIYINPVAPSSADLLGHRYFMVPAYLNSPQYEYGGDIFAYMDIIELTLKRELGMLAAKIK